MSSFFRLVDAFGGTIRSAVEDNITNKIREGMMKLDSLLQSLPKKIPVNDIVAMNVTFVGNPVLSNSSVELEINGLFTAIDDLASELHLKASSVLVYCTKMIEMSLHENVFNSLSSVLFDVSFMPSFLLIWLLKYCHTLSIVPSIRLQDIWS